MSAFLASVIEVLSHLKKVDALGNDLRTARDGAAETTTRLDAATEKVPVFEADLEKQKKGRRTFDDGAGQLELAQF